MRTKKARLSYLLIAFVAVIVFAVAGGFALSQPATTQNVGIGNNIATADANAPAATATDYIGRVRNANYIATTYPEGANTEYRPVQTAAQLKEFLTRGTVDNVNVATAYLTNDIPNFNWTELAFPKLASKDAILQYGKTIDGCGFKVTFDKYETNSSTSKAADANVGAVVSADELSATFKNIVSDRADYELMPSHVYGAFASIIRGTLKNMVFELSYYNDGYLFFRSPDSETNIYAYAGCLTGFVAETGTVENVKVDNKMKSFGVHRGQFNGPQWNNNKAGYYSVITCVGGVAGCVAGKINKAEIFLDGAKLHSYAWGELKICEAVSYVGGIAGRTVGTGSINNVVIGGNAGVYRSEAKATGGGIITAYPLTRAWNGGIVGDYSSSVSMKNVIFKGSISAEKAWSDNGDGADYLTFGQGGTAVAGMIRDKDCSGIMNLDLDSNTTRVNGEDINIYFDADSRLRVISGGDNIIWNVGDSNTYEQVSNSVGATPTLNPKTSIDVVKGTTKGGDVLFFDGDNEIAEMNAQREYKGSPFDVKIKLSDGTIIESDNIQALGDLKNASLIGKPIQLTATQDFVYFDTDSRTIVPKKSLNLDRTLLITVRTITCDFDDYVTYDVNNEFVIGNMAGEDIITCNNNPLPGNRLVSPNVNDYVFKAPENYLFDDGTTERWLTIEPRVVTLNSTFEDGAIWNIGQTVAIGNLSGNGIVQNNIFGDMSNGTYNYDRVGTYTFRTDRNHIFADEMNEIIIEVLPRTITIEETNINTGMDIYSNSSVAFSNLLAGDVISVNDQTIANDVVFDNFATAGVYNFQLPNNNYVFEDELENYLIEVLPKKVTLNNGIVAEGYVADKGVITIETRVDNIKVSASMDMYGVRFEDIVANNGAVLEDKFITNTSVTATVPMSSSLNEVSLIGAVKKVYTVTAVGGTASASQVDFADKVTLSAAIPSGKAFAGWKIGGNVVSYLPEYTFRVTSDIIAEAVFVDVAAEDIYTHIFLDLGGFEFKTIKNSIANMTDTDEVVLANELALNFMGWKVKSNKDNTITYSPIYESDESIKVLVNNVETLYNQAIVLEGGKTYSVNGVAVAPTSDMTIYAVSDMTIEEVAATEQVAVTTRVDKVGTMNYISGTVVSAEAIESVSFDFAGSNYVMYIDKYVQTGNVRQFCVYVSDELLAKVFGQSGKISGNISVNGVVVGTEVKLREA